MTNIETTAGDVSPPRIPIPNYPNYPNPKRKLGQAWAAAYAELAALPDGEYLDGPELATRSAEAVGLQATTLVSLLHRAASAGILERSHRKVNTESRGPRTRTFYRVAA